MAADEQLPRPFGKYHLIEKVATGGMAELYRAKLYGAGGFEKDLAIKQVLPHLSREKSFVQMFLDEAMITVTLNHGNIVSVLDFGQVENEYYLAMEFVDGVDLQALINRCRELDEPFPPEVAAAIAAEVCRGLDYAHDKVGSDGQALNIVHRDISPQNVLLSFEGQVKLVDFGIARAASRITSTQAGVVKGKVHYMSPEQLTGAGVDKRSDIFALGICLYEMLTCQRPFDGDTPTETLALISQGKFTPAHKRNKQVHKKLSAIVSKALESKPQKRYQRAGRMASAISKFLHSADAYPSTTDLAVFVRQRLPECKPRVKAPTPEPVRTPAAIPASTPKKDAARPEAQAPAPPTPGPEAKPQPEHFPSPPGTKEALPQSQEPKEPEPVVVDGEAVSFGILDLPKNYVFEERSLAEALEAPEPSPAAAEEARAGDEERPEVDLHAPTRVMDREAEPAKETEPEAGAEPDVDLQGPTRMMEPSPAHKTDTDEWSMGGQAEEPEFDDGPTLKRPRESHTGLWILLVVLLLGGGGFALWHFDPLGWFGKATAPALAPDAGTEKPAADAGESMDAAASAEEPNAQRAGQDEPAGHSPEDAGEDAAAAEVPAPKGPPQTKPSSVRRPRPARGPKGTLQLQTDIPAKVYLGHRRYLGKTPKLKVRLPAGSHTLVLKNKAQKITKRIRVRIEAEQEHKLTVEMK